VAKKRFLKGPRYLDLADPDISDGLEPSCSGLLVTADARNCTKLSELPMKKIGHLFLDPLVKFVLLPKKSDILEMGKP
jgi:hypothetical protein